MCTKRCRGVRSRVRTPSWCHSTSEGIPKSSRNIRTTSFMSNFRVTHNSLSTTRVARPELSGMSRLRSGQSTLDARVRPFRRTTLQLRLRTQESAAALSPGTVPSTIRTRVLSDFVSFAGVPWVGASSRNLARWIVHPLVVACGEIRQRRQTFLFQFF